MKHWISGALTGVVIIAYLCTSAMAEQQYIINTDISRIWFEAESSLHDFTGRSAEISGDIRLDASNIRESTVVEIAVQAKSLSTANRMRDHEMFRRLLADSHPQILYCLTSVERIDSVDTPGGVRLETSGTLTVAGVTRDIRMDVLAVFQSDGSIRIQGGKALRMSEFGIDPPKVMSLIRVKDEVRVQFDIQCAAAPTGKFSGEEK